MGKRDSIDAAAFFLGINPQGIVDSRAAFDWEGNDGTWLEIICIYTMAGPDTVDLAVEHRDTDSDSWVQIPNSTEVSWSSADGNGVYSVFVERAAAKRQVSLHLHNAIGAPPWAVAFRTGGDEDRGGVAQFDEVITTKSVDGLS